MAPGDFVRTVRQVADLAGQVALVAPDPATGSGRPGRRRRLLRDVVAAGSPLAASATGEAPQT